jgi:hypothetical protein
VGVACDNCLLKVSIKLNGFEIIKIKMSVYIISTYSGTRDMNALRFNFGSSWRGVVKLNTLATLILGKEPLVYIERELRWAPE